MRAVGPEDLALLGRWRNDTEHGSAFGDFLPMIRRQNSYQERWDVNGLLGEDEGTLLVCLSGEPVGTISWHPVHYGPNRGSQALNLGIAIAPGARGQGVGTLAQRLAYEWLFRHTTVNRVEASTDVENVAEQKALEKAGYTREGVLRGTQFRRGHWHDLVQYSRLRND
nr:GNAT family protein [Kineosporia rhizophila]